VMMKRHASWHCVHNNADYPYACTFGENYRCFIADRQAATSACGRTENKSPVKLDAE